MPPETAPVGDIETIVDQATTSDRPWLVIVWNDPINLMSFVTFVLQKLFGYSKEKATKLMLDVHHKGRAVVSSGTRERAELDVYRLHEHGLWATMEQSRVERRPIKRRRGRALRPSRLDASARVGRWPTWPAQLPDALVGADDPMTRRLFPPAYAADDQPTAEQDYRELVRRGAGQPPPRRRSTTLVGHGRSRHR